MAFGFFKKEEKADLIFSGGKIYTQDANLPWAEAVACKDGVIIAVGDEETVMTLAGDDTNLVDLEGGTMLPGFIDMSQTVADEIFNDLYIDLSDCQDFDDISGLLHDRIGELSEQDAYFACGVCDKAVNGKTPDEIKEMLDEICADKPLVLVHQNGYSVVMNTLAFDEVREAAIENDIKYLTLPFIVSVLSLIDFDTVRQRVIEAAASRCEKGFTSVVSGGTLDYFNSTHQDVLIEMLQENMLKQRFYSLLCIYAPQDEKNLVGRLRQKQTLCVDMDNQLNFAGLQLLPVEESFANAEGALLDMCLAAADAGFNIMLEAKDKPSAIEALDIFETVQSKGYRKNMLILSHNEDFDNEERANYSLGDLIQEMPLRSADFLENAADVSEAVDLLTVDAAILLGVYDKLGSIERGKLADFTVFNENPLDCLTVAELKKLSAVMTVMNGQIVYDEEEDILSEWYELLLSQQY